MSTKTAMSSGDQFSAALTRAPSSPVKTVKIFNLHSNDTKEAEDFKVISHEEYDKYGKKVVNHYVQYTVIGKNRTWPDFCPVEEFKKLNPKIKVEGLN